MNELLKIGFTGTREGMNSIQEFKLLCFLAKACVDNEKVEFHHGDCIGADAKAHEIALRFEKIDVIIHPPKNEKYRAFCKGYSRIARAFDYLERNKHIVEATDVLLVAPKTNEEELRSGTWSTYRYAKRLNKRILVLFKVEPPQPLF